MKLSKSNIKIILFIVAVAILGLTYLYVFNEHCRFNSVRGRHITGSL